MNWKRIGRLILFPHPALVWTLLPAALGLMFFCSGTYESTDAISIVSYVFSFYGLMLVIFRIPAIVQAVRKFKRENKYVVLYTSDIRLRMNLSLMRSLVFNAVYATFQLGLGIWHHSVWFYAMAGYYLLLAMMRLLLVRYTGSHAAGEQQEIEWKKYRLCGVFLMMITFALSVFITYFIWNIRVFRHHEITTITMATYTFAALGLAIANAVRYKRYQSPVYSAAKAISLASAVVSVLTLENTMLTVFGQGKDEVFRQYMLGASGVTVIFIVQGIAVHMIRKAGKNLRAIHNS
ncbi:MAG: hypothetical protein IJ418_09575 [Clostridia bacterium]|nr:hypothetical protein [Clostridia bacterium]